MNRCSFNEAEADRLGNLEFHHTESRINVGFNEAEADRLGNTKTAKI